MPSYKFAFRSSVQKTDHGREDTRVWYGKTMFSQVVSYDFPLHRPLHEYFLYLASAPPETQKALRIKKAICVVRRNSIIIGVT